MPPSKRDIQEQHGYDAIEREHRLVPKPDLRAWDTSRRGTRADRGLKSTPRTHIPARLFFVFTLEWLSKEAANRKGKAPAGYGFTKRGDLINLRKRATRLARRMS